MTKQRTARGSTRRAALATFCMTSLWAGAAHATGPSAPACDLVMAAREDFSMQVPFETIDGRIYVQARINGRGPYRFAVDTGASGMGRADTRLVAALGLAIEAPTTHSDGVESAKVDTTRLGSLELGGLSRENLQVITRDYSGKMPAEAAFAGIIARGFFADGLLVIDYPGKTLSFSRKLSLAPGQDGVLTYERPFRVPVSIAGMSAEGNLDTGANVAFVLPRPVFDKVGGTPLQQAGPGQLANSRVETMRSTVHGPFRIGHATLWDAEVRVSERYPEILVGAHALSGFALLIDQRSNSVALCQ